VKIIVIEDEILTALFLQETLEKQGNNVVGVFDSGANLFNFLEKNDVDLIFMDINIKGKTDGIQLAESVSQKYSHINVVFITAYKDSDTIKASSKVQPVGYLIKPVLTEDIEAILMVVESQHSPNPVVKSHVILVGEYCYNSKEKTLRRGESYIALGKYEHLCLGELFKHKGTPVGAEHLIYTVWGKDENRATSLRELTSRLRKKLPGLMIKNLPNIGYTLSSS